MQFPMLLKVSDYQTKSKATLGMLRHFQNKWMLLLYFCLLDQLK